MEMSRDGYRCSAGESFDKVAMDLYGDEIYAAELLCANPERENENLSLSRTEKAACLCLGRVLLKKRLPMPVYGT